ncbi:MAG: aminodeoxychorismate/anthranilate synthase component II [Alphaproteobacteria bacterium]|nr:aminodeoxychorismate/anthranilate synthase component II [Alphaproteobacteria bacterium]
MILVVDNYDSFTWNLVHLIEAMAAEVRVVRNDALSADDALATGAAGILLSPGPGRPEAAGITPVLVAACAGARRPLLGICLGHQAIAAGFGAAIVRAPRPVHGKVSAISHGGEGIFTGLPSPFPAARYNSLTVAPVTLPAALAITARAEDGTVQGLAHRKLPLHGVQFHPESIASAHGSALLANFLRLCRGAAGRGTKAA